MSPNYLIRLDAEETKPLQLNFHSSSLKPVPLFPPKYIYFYHLFFSSCLYALLALCLAQNQDRDGYEPGFLDLLHLF